jgi:hypothetical protein
VPPRKKKKPVPEGSNSKCPNPLDDQYCWLWIQKVAICNVETQKWWCRQQFHPKQQKKQ